MNSSTTNVYQSDNYMSESTPILSQNALEQPKTPLRRYFNPLRHLIHPVALAASAAVLQLSFRNVYWSDETRWNRKWYLLELGQQDTLNALQFVAKVHEILVVASLSSMVIHVARRKIVGPDGVPFGLLMGAYQVGSAEYLFSGSFSHPFLRSMRPFDRKYFVLALGIALAIIYANMVGPASAIAVIPNLDWWLVRDPYSGRSLPAYIGLPASQGYPTVVSAEVAAEERVGTCNVTEPPIQCPGGGYDSIEKWAFAWAQEGIVYDIPMPSLLVRAQRELAFRLAPAPGSGSGVAFSTTLKSSAAMMADLFWQYISTHDVGTVSRVERPQLLSSRQSHVYAPLVQVQCDVADYDAQRGRGDGLFFQTNLLSNFSSANSYRGKPKWEVPRQFWDFDRPRSSINFTWIGTSELDVQQPGTMHASIAALVTIPSVSGTKQDNGSHATEQKSILAPCVVDARWAATEVSYDPRNSVVVRHNLSDLSDFMDPAAQNADARGRLGLGDAILIEPDWAELLNPVRPGFGDVEQDPVVFQNRSAMQNLLYQFVVASSDGGDAQYYGFAPPQRVADAEYYANVSSIVASLLGMVVADGLARASHGPTLMELGPGHGGNVTLVNLQFLAGGQEMDPFEHSVDDMRDLLPVTFLVRRWGYGYGLRGQTVMFAVVVLFIHAALCACYFVATFWFWAFQKGWTSHSWKDMGDLVALALGSREPTEFRNTGAGIKNPETLNVTMNIRERGASGLELVANWRGGGLAEGPLRVRKRYGS